MMPKITPIAMTKEDSVRQWKMTEKWIYRFKDIDIIIPKNFTFDGASIPRIFRRLYSPTGYLFLAALVHDFCYEKAYYSLVRKKVNTYTTKVDVSRKEADKLFKDIAKKEYPGHTIKTAVAYLCLRIGGWVAWNKHRKKK